MKDHTIKLADVIFGEENRSFFDFLKYCFYGIFIYLNIQIELMTILAGLMALDTISGVLKSFRLGRKFSFKILSWGFVSKFLILLIPLIVALMGKPIHKDFTWVVDVALRILIINEGLSILANIVSVYTQKNIQNVDLITKLHLWTRCLFLGIAQKTLDNINIEEDERKDENTENS